MNPESNSMTMCLRMSQQVTIMVICCLANITFRGLFTLKGREIPSTFVSDQYSGIYDDLKSDAPYYQAAKTLLYLDYADDITPFDRDRDGFFPDGNEYRINVLKALMEAFNIKPDTEGTNNPFPNDPDIAQLAETSPVRMGYVRQAAQLGIITTENTQFHPFVDCLRGEAFLMLARIIQMIEAKEIADPNLQEIDFLDPNSGPVTVDPNAEAYAVLSQDYSVLTFYYDGQKAARNGMSVGPFITSSKRGWYANRGSITRVIFHPSFAFCTTLTSTGYWFDGLWNLSSITGICNLKTDNVTDMGGMFSDCSSLTSLDVTGFNTGKVTDMGGMFSECSSLTSLDVSGFKTGNVTNMGGMFLGCSSLTSLDVSGFNTGKVTDMGGMFSYCDGLKSLNLSGFKTDNVTDMGSMFNLSKGLKRIDMTGFNTGKVGNMHGMFSGCSGLKTIYAGDGWSTASVQDGGSMFYDCTNLVGGAGTHYDAGHTDHTYAHIDEGTANPGYFTAKTEGSDELPEGDLNEDGDVDEDDVAVLVNVVMGIDKNKFADADLNHDEKVDAADVVKLVNIIMSRK